MSYLNDIVLAAVLCRRINVSQTIRNRAAPVLVHLKRTDWLVSGQPLQTLVRVERAMRFELTTSTLARLRSTPELRPRPASAFAKALI